VYTLILSSLGNLLSKKLISSYFIFTKTNRSLKLKRGIDKYGIEFGGGKKNIFCDYGVRVRVCGCELIRGWELEET